VGALRGNLQSQLDVAGNPRESLPDFDPIERHNVDDSRSIGRDPAPGHAKFKSMGSRDNSRGNLDLVGCSAVPRRGTDRPAVEEKVDSMLGHSHKVFGVGKTQETGTDSDGYGSIDILKKVEIELARVGVDVSQALPIPELVPLPVVAGHDRRSLVVAFETSDNGW